MERFACDVAIHLRTYSEPHVRGSTAGEVTSKEMERKLSGS